VEGSTLRDTIVGGHSTIVRSSLANSLIGDHVVLDGFTGELTAGDHTEIRGRG
jgi:hypothetical protein